MSLFRCELWNNYGDKGGQWIKVELVGDNWLHAFFRRFGNIANYRTRNWEYLDPNTGEWRPMEADAE